MIEELTYYTVSGHPRKQMVIKSTEDDPLPTIIGNMAPHDPGDVSIIDEAEYETLMAAKAQEIQDSIAAMRQELIDAIAAKAAARTALKAELLGLGVSQETADNYFD